jgi:hypothetical protein
VASLSPSLNSQNLLEMDDRFAFATHGEHNLKKHFYARLIKYTGPEN